MSVESLLVRAEKYLQTAAMLFETGDYASSISRAFYAMLFATRAALRTRELDPSTHKGVFTLFNEHFIQSNELPRHLSRTLRRAMDVRQLADYAEDEAGFGEEEALSILDDAQHFVEQHGSTSHNILRISILEIRILQYQIQHLVQPVYAHHLDALRRDEASVGFFC